MNIRSIYTFTPHPCRRLDRNMGPVFTAGMWYPVLLANDAKPIKDDTMLDSSLAQLNLDSP